jgi:hypothetical protein
VNWYTCIIHFPNHINPVQYFHTRAETRDDAERHALEWATEPAFPDVSVEHVFNGKLEANTDYSSDEPVKLAAPPAPAKASAAAETDELRDAGNAMADALSSIHRTPHLVKDEAACLVRRWRIATAAAALADGERQGVVEPLESWREDDGQALWWLFPVVVAPYVGSPLDLDWPGYHTHWTRLPALPAPAPSPAQPGQQPGKVDE